MADRRNAPRFAFASPAQAHLHLTQDVVVERSNANQLTVLSASSSTTGEQLALRLRALDGRVATVPVCTLASRPVILDGGSIRYRLDLRVVGVDTPAASEEC